MKIAVFTKNLLNPAYQAARLGADRAAARAGARVEHYVPETPDDITQQIALIDRALEDRPDAIVLAAVHPTQVNAAIHRINAAGIPMVTYVSRLTAGQCISFVGADDYALAFDIACYLFERLSGKGDVAIVEGPAESVTGQARTRAFADAAARYPGIRIAARCNGHYQREPARLAMAGLLGETPKIDAVLAANDIMALGALEALGAAGMKVPMVGINAIPEAVAAIRSGAMLASADFNAMNMAYLATECALRHLSGERVPEEILLPARIVDHGNCAEWDLPYEARQCAQWVDVVKEGGE